jgi:hypothetical protein
MKSYFGKLAALAAFSVLTLTSARAVTLTINNGLGGAIGGEVGTIIPASPASMADEVVYINDLLALVAPTASGRYTTTAWDFNGTVSALGSTDNVNTNLDNGSPNPDFYNTISGFEYVLGKYGNAAVVWYLGGAEFVIPLTLDVPGGQGDGLSHWIAFNPGSKVPDGGATVVLLGLGLVGMSFIARRRLAA